MKGTVLGFGLTAAAWAVLAGLYSLIELLRGDSPWAMMQWSLGGKFITITVLTVVAIGTGIGFASDRFRERRTRTGL